MKKLFFALMALLLFVSCGKENTEPENPNIDKLVYGGSWHAFTGETYDVEEFMTIVGDPISLGIKTEKLASGFFFSRNGTGTRSVTYYAPKGMVNDFPYDYGSFDFTWEINENRITITNTSKDSNHIIPDSCTIDIGSFSSDRFSGKYNGKSMTFLTDVAWIDEL